jgi:hypothetical protein
MHLLASVTPLNRHLLPFPFTARREQVYSMYRLFYKGEFILPNPGASRRRRSAAWRSLVLFRQGTVRPESGWRHAYGGDGIEWVSEAYSPAQLDFDEDEGVGTKVQSTMTPGLVFRVLLGDGIPDVRFERTSGVLQAR